MTYHEDKRSKEIVLAAAFGMCSCGVYEYCAWRYPDRPLDAMTALSV